MSRFTTTNYEFSFTYPSTIVDSSSSSLLAPPWGTQVLSACWSCCCFGRPLPRPLPTPCEPGAVVAAGNLDVTGGFFDLGGYASLTRLVFTGWRGSPAPLSSKFILVDGAVLRTQDIWENGTDCKTAEISKKKIKAQTPFLFLGQNLILISS